MQSHHIASMLVRLHALSAAFALCRRNSAEWIDKRIDRARTASRLEAWPAALVRVTTLSGVKDYVAASSTTSAGAAAMREATRSVRPGTPPTAGLRARGPSGSTT